MPKAWIGQEVTVEVEVDDQTKHGVTGLLRENTGQVPPAREE